jgi:hypothetical protein
LPPLFLFPLFSSCYFLSLWVFLSSGLL